MRLRPAVATDQAALARVWRSAWASANPHVTAEDLAPPAHWLARVQQELWASPAMLTLVVEGADPQIQAFLSVDTAHSYLAQLHVAPEHQGCGIGSQLIQHIANTLFPQGWSLHVAQENVRARRFYQSHGLSEQATSTHPVTGRRRVLCVWQGASLTRQATTPPHALATLSTARSEDHSQGAPSAL